jgi:hypothetical protein
MFYVNDNIFLLHANPFFMQMRCFVVLPLSVIQHIHFYSVVLLSHQVSFISVFIQTLSGNMGYGSFKSFSFQGLSISKHLNLSPTLGGGPSQTMWSPFLCWWNRSSEVVLLVSIWYPVLLFKHFVLSFFCYMTVFLMNLISDILFPIF